jgi:hypothetical protein
MNFLYKSASGKTVTHGSSSSLDIFHLCRRKFKLSKIDGWREKAKKASLEFGKCIESAVQFYHANGLKQGEATLEFERLWLKFAEIKDLTFTDQEKDFWTLLAMGREMTKLYEILLPTLPIRNPKFQLQFLKPLWPGDPTYGDLEFMAYIDLLSTLDDGTQIVLDIKTAAKPLDVTPGMLAMDGQLRRYSWVTGIRNVGFLNFVKAEPEGFKAGYRVTLLEDTLTWKAGQSLTVVKFVAPKPAVEATETTKAVPEANWLLLLADTETIRLMDEELDKISGKGATEKKDQVYAQYLSEGKLCAVPRSAVTKTKLQCVQAVIPEEDLADIGTAIGTDMISMKTAADTGSYPMDGGVRFPNAICGWCSFRGICLKDNSLRDEMLVQLNPTAPEKDWLDELEEIE